MIRSWADLVAFLEDGGRFTADRSDPGETPTWRVCGTDEEIAMPLACRAIADGVVVGADHGDRIVYYKRSAA